MATTEAHKDQMSDFDLAYAWPRASPEPTLWQAILRKPGGILAHARRAGDEILDPDSRIIFENDLQAGDWYGVQ